MMRDRDEATILTGLLDFYSDRATAHASFLVAVLLGLFVILDLSAKPNAFDILILFWTYWAVWFFGLYCLLNFGLYARFAEKTKDLLLKGCDSEKIDSIDEQIVDQTLLNWKRTLIKNIFVKSKYPRRKIDPSRYQLKKMYLKPSDFFASVYFLLAFLLSSTFFGEFLAVSLMLWILFCGDWISIFWNQLKWLSRAST